MGFLAKAHMMEIPHKRAAVYNLNRRPKRPRSLIGCQPISATADRQETGSGR
jgi:hypothetical protein